MGKQRGPVVATLDCIKGHLESVADLCPCLSLSLCQRQQVGRVLTCLLRTRKNTLFGSQCSDGGWPSWSLTPAVSSSSSAPGPWKATLHRSGGDSQLMRSGYARLLFRPRGYDRLFPRLTLIDRKCCRKHCAEMDSKPTSRTDPHGAETR